jgi:UDP-N-acetylglucosamine 2-epimerase
MAPPVKRLLIFAGTRPEAIKVAPVVRALREMEDVFEARLCSTGQHREMLQQAFADFDLAPDVDLKVMAHDQTLAALSGRLFPAIDGLLERERPDAILVQGDTTTVQIAALCGFYRSIPVGHIEAGLRSGDLAAPFPEEMNRRIATQASRWHFAPTERARANLLAEHVPDEAIFVTGNTVIDSLLEMAARVRRMPPPLPPRLEALAGSGRPIVLITGHRRESFGQGFEDICTALARLAKAHPDVAFVYPVHLNPNVSEIVGARLSGIDNIMLERPLAYRAFVRMMDVSRLILTDSGGVQEEAPSLGKPVLVMREVTERPEGVEAGVSRLVGSDPEVIVKAVGELLTDEAAYRRMASAQNPYGDGTAGRRIAAVLRAALSP